MANLITPELTIQLESDGRTPLSRLTGLIRLFRDWGNNFPNDDATQEQLEKLSSHDIDALKKIIFSEVNKTQVSDPDIASDQILFLLLGAIQSQSRGAHNAWDIVQDSIVDILKPVFNFKPYFWTGLFFLAISMATSAYLFSQSKPNTVTLANMEITPESISSVLPASLTALQGVYSQMKSGVCDLPQAGMLPEEQRQAFLNFINYGIVDVSSVKSLQTALAHVNCYYPQTLMIDPNRSEKP